MAGEVYVEQDNKQAILFYLSWTTSNAVEAIPELSWIQSYAQFEDHNNPGKYMQATCNVGYDPEKREASGSAIDVGTFYGESIAVADLELH